MEKETRNRIQRATQAARRLLEHDYAEQLEGVFDIRLSGKVAPEAPAHLSAAQRILRAKMVAAIDHHRAAGMKPAEAIEAYLRETAFTTLNRFVALKMMEARELVQACVSHGEQSAGFKEFAGLAPGLAQQPDHGYRLYLEAVFDELSTHIRVLFDRTDATSLLWPRRATLEGLLALLNDTDLAAVWAEDETIGWIYQYYNDEAERKQMRAESAAPRNSRELAVRNQFFTPRYVVEFLTDNTLGRIWYEMRQGQTALTKRCRYLVRRPTEIFLQPDEAAPDPPNKEGLSQEELLRQPVHIPHRPLKDPREIRLLDPACGSMHFGLYAFDLYLTIYDEAWELAQDPHTAISDASFAPFVAFVASFPDKTAFLREVPRLIVEHNIHGIDIDPRAVQIANLSLWLRAQRAWNELAVRPTDRPRVARSHIVCAEPMPGEKELLREFVEQQFPAGERPAFTFLLETIFDRMTLAGEAGSLLRIEEEIRTAIADAKRLWKQGPRAEQGSLFANPSDKAGPGDNPVNLSGITDEQFWAQAEQRMYGALETYAGQAENGGGFQRRLFAEGAAQGFAFIDLCRKRYDVVVMNPPFGEPSEPTTGYLESQFPSWNQNLLCAFLIRGWNLLNHTGMTAAIFDRTAIVKSTYEPFRRDILIPDSRLGLMADLGWEVLDANVEVTTCILKKSHFNPISIFIDVRTDRPEDKGASLADAISIENSGSESAITIHESPARFSHLPNAVIGYDFPEFLRRAFATFDSLETVGFKANQGFALKADKHFRVWWEIGNSKFSVINRMFNGSGYSPYVTALLDCAVSRVEPEDLPMDSSTRKSGLGAHRLPGVCFGKRGDYFAAHILPSGHIFTVEGQSIPVSDPSDALVLVGYLNTPLVRFALNKYCGQHKYSGYVNLLPFVSPNAVTNGAQSVQHVFRTSVVARRFDEIQSFFVALPRGNNLASIADEFKGAIQAASDVSKDCERHFQHDIAGRLGLRKDEFGLIQKFAESQPAAEAPVEDVGHLASIDAFAARAKYSYTIGCAFGRWDIRYATGQRPAPELPDPFAPLPVCPPGMLQGDDGLPLSPEAGRLLRAEGRYPLEVAWEGILVDDSEHPLDVERRVRDALAVIWSGRVEAIEQEASEILGVASLREWFRKPTAFFADHLKRYSKSRRQAPIYWSLSSAGGSYTVWLYYHRFSADTLYRALDLVNEKVAFEERKLGSLTTAAAGGSTASQRKDLTDQEALVSELRAFQEELARVAPLWNPNLNDGVILNYGPLWRMIGHTPWQKSVKEKWDDLCSGKYDWAHLALHLWPERVVPKCAEDRSLAIAHGLEDVFWVEGKDGKWSARPAPTRPVEELVRERTSPAVKAALESLLNAPAPVGKTRKRKK